MKHLNSKFPGATLFDTRDSCIRRILSFSFSLLLVSVAVQALADKPKPGYLADATTYAQTVKKITDVMIEDVTGPCAAARYYTYANLASYEIIKQQAPPENFLSFDGILNDYPDFSQIKTVQAIDVNFASLYALLRMGEELLPSGYLLAPHIDQLLLAADKKFRIKEAKIRASKAYADSVVNRMVKYAARDGYVKTSGYMRYTPLEQPGAWKPTPPGYMEAYEPHWASLRPFLLDSTGQFKPLPPVPYDDKQDSRFYALAKGVYDATRAITPEQELIAGFWDCNPFFLNQKGHISFGTKKISPAGHWMGITGIASVQKGIAFSEAVRWHAFVSITMADAFVSCWKEKYNSNRIRPETFINEKIDRDWRPLLQTPPFPEYTSGHSVVSSSVAAVLSRLAGHSFAYVDTVEEEFGLPSRAFKSFKEAAREAAISRFYGGIHFLDAIENGVSQGEQIGEFMIKKLKLE